MPSSQEIERLTSVADEIRSIDTEALTRPALGVESLKEQLQPRLHELEEKLSLAVEYASEIPSGQIDSMSTVLESLKNSMREFANIRNNAAFIHRGKKFLQEFDNYMDQLKENWSPVIIAAIQSKGLLDDDGVKKAHNEAVQELKMQASRTLEEIQVKSEESIAKARELAEQIERSARQTATGISVKEAQKQFENAQEQLDQSVRNWSIISSIPIALFALLSVYFWNQQGPFELGVAIYHTSMRVAVLGLLGALSAYCLRVLRAHIHMKQQNLHRQRVANSIEAFVQSAVTPEQRDLILSYLVHSIIAFGNSGLVQQREEIVNPSHFAVDSINRALKSSDSDRS